MPLVCDSGPLLAALDAGDAWHRRCRVLLETSREDLVVPGLVLAEVDYWCHKRRIPEAWIAFLEDVDAGSWIVEWPTARDLTRALEVQRSYPEVGVVDASVLALVERLDESKLATLDQRHFRLMRPAHRDALTLLPGTG